MVTVMPSGAWSDTRQVRIGQECASWFIDRSYRHTDMYPIILAPVILASVILASARHIIHITLSRHNYNNYVRIALSKVIA